MVGEHGIQTFEVVVVVLLLLMLSFDAFALSAHPLLWKITLVSYMYYTYAKLLKLSEMGLSNIVMDMLAPSLKFLKHMVAIVSWGGLFIPQTN